MHTRYWFEFDIDRSDWVSPASALRLGCGVTGTSREDCLGLIRERIVKGASLPAIKREVVDVDISTLDEKHVIPNMASIFPRGVWFPLGY